MPHRSALLNTRNVAFVGGVPRPLRAADLATHLTSIFGDVIYTGIDTDTELKYGLVLLSRVSL